MHELPDRRAEAFLDALEAALGGPGPRAAEVLAEVRSDLEAAVARALREGSDEQAAWNRALDDLGDPQALAVAMRGELPPEMPAAWVAHARRALAVLVAAWAVEAAWSTRSWDYGDRLFSLGFMFGLPLPLVLLLWPGIVWRWNAFFSTAAAGGALAFAGFAMFGGSTSEITYVLPAEFPATEVLEAPPLLDGATLAAAIALSVSALALSLVQQRRQRRAIVLGAAVLALAIDLPHTIEEHLFSREARAVAAWAAAERARTGAWPTDEEFAAGYEPALLDRLHYRATGSDDSGFSLFWSRSTQRTSELGYHADGTFWGND